MEWNFENKIKSLERENIFLHKVVDKFKETIEKFINWVCKKFDVGAEYKMIKELEEENNCFLDAEKQIEHEQLEKEHELEL